MRTKGHTHGRGVRGMAMLALALFLSLQAAYTEVLAQPTSKVLSIDDYSRWRNISGSAISGDGNWVVYELRNTNLPTADARPLLNILQVETNRNLEIPNASGATFSDDSRWVAYTVEPPPPGRGGRGAGAAGTGGGGSGGAGGGSGGGAGGGATPPPVTVDTTPGVGVAPGQPPQGQPAQGRGGAATPPPARRVELRELATGNIRTWQDVQSFAFAPGSSHLLLRRRPATQNAQHRGVDAVLHDLQTGRDKPLANVAESSFNRRGDLLAYYADGAVRDGNGLFIEDLREGRTIALDNDARIYNRLTWNSEGTALAVLKGLPVERMRERNNMLMVIPDVRGALTNPEFTPTLLDPATAAGFPKGWVVSERATLSWSGNGKLLFLGIKEQVPAVDTSGRRGPDFVVNVDVWNTRDERIQSLQMNRADAERNFTFRQAFEPSTGRFIQLSDSTLRDLTITRDGRWAIGNDNRSYVSDYERPRGDYYRVNTSTGERTPLLTGQITGHVAGTSLDGKYMLYWKDNQYHTYDLDALSTRMLTRGAPVNFVNMEFDNPGPRPAYGIVGYTSDSTSVLLSHRYDIWQLSLDGSVPPRNLTGGIGTKNEIRLSYLRIASDSGELADAPSPGIDVSQPMLFSAYGQWTKKSGFYELRDGAMREIIFEDASFAGLTKATKADRFLFTRQSFVEFPDLRVSGPDLADSRKISNANPHHSEYAWGRRVLIDYKNKNGVRLQGVLSVPDDYQQGERRPMLVTFYEKQSQNMHRYTAPAFLGGMGSVPVEALSKGYLILQADIHFRTGSSHSDMLECVEAAVKKVIELGYADAKRIGVNGHSYGGEGAAYIATHSKMFAAVGMGAGVTDLTSDFTHNWGWSYTVTGGSGANGFNYYIYGQGRWGTNPFDDPELYRNQSARPNARNVVAPVLIMHGTSDPTVSFQEGLGFYNALRFNGKQAVLLAYPGEGHSLRGLANRRDLTIRYMQFFDHYLRGAAAPKWLSDGVPFLAKDGTKDPG